MLSKALEIVFTNRDHPIITVTCRHGSTTENFSLRKGESTPVRPAGSLRYAWRDDDVAITSAQLAQFGSNVGASKTITFGQPAGSVAG